MMKQDQNQFKIPADVVATSPPSLQSFAEMVSHLTPANGIIVATAQLDEGYRLTNDAGGNVEMTLAQSHSTIKIQAKANTNDVGFGADNKVSQVAEYTHTNQMLVNAGVAVFFST